MRLWSLPPLFCNRFRICFGVPLMVRVAACRLMDPPPAGRRRTGQGDAPCLLWRATFDRNPGAPVQGAPGTGACFF